MSGAEDEGKTRKRVIFPMGTYSDNKNAIKAPFKELGLSWQYLGKDGDDTKGRYSDEATSVFVVYSSEHADFTIETTDPDALDLILSAWEAYDTMTPADEEAPEDPMSEAEAKALRLWRFGKPAPRPGEPEHFYEKRLQAWRDEDPRE